MDKVDKHLMKNLTACFQVPLTPIMDSCRSLKIVMLPWLAMGHLIPFLELSKRLAKKGHHIYFITTPKNISRLPNIPANLSSSLHLISIPLPHLDRVPDDAESSMDVPPTMQPFLKTRFDLLEHPVSTVLDQVKPDWILYDFTSHWIPSLAENNGVACAFICLFNAATMSFIGPPAALLEYVRTSPDDYTVVPDWIPFQSDITYYPHEVIKFKHSIDAEIATSDTVRFSDSITGCDVVAIRTSPEFESIWIDLLEKLYEKTVLPIGFLFPDCTDNTVVEDGKWVLIKKWLDQRNVDSVLYVALGSESSISQDELQELALGLEQCGLPFIFVLRDLPGLEKNELDMLPERFENRVVERGLVCRGWAPQVKILSHPATRGFLTHCGWNSIVEGLGLGRVLVLLPMMNDQGLVARLLVGKGLGVEIERNKVDGSLRRECIATSVRLAMVEKEGEELRTSCKNMKRIFGELNVNDHYIEAFVNYLQDHRNI